MVNDKIRLNQEDFESFEREIDQDLLKMPITIMESLINLEKQFQFDNKQELIFRIKKITAMWNLGNRDDPFVMLDNIVEEALAHDYNNVLIKA